MDSGPSAQWCYIWWYWFKEDRGYLVFPYCLCRIYCCPGKTFYDVKSLIFSFGVRKKGPRHDIPVVKYTVCLCPLIRLYLLIYFVGMKAALEMITFLFTLVLLCVSVYLVGKSFLYICACTYYLFLHLPLILSFLNLFPKDRNRLSDGGKVSLAHTRLCL